MLLLSRDKDHNKLDKITLTATDHLNSRNQHAHLQVNISEAMLGW